MCALTVPPNARLSRACFLRYTEQWQKRAAAIAKDKMTIKSWDNYPSYPSETSPAVKSYCAKVSGQLALWKGRKGANFGRDWVLEVAEDMPAYLWWDNHGSGTPELQTIARLVLAQPASASIIERINSEFEFVKDRRRNRLAHVKADKLVRLFHNLRLLKRMKSNRYVEPAVAWTSEENESGIKKWGIPNFDLDKCSIGMSTVAEE